MKDSLLEGKQIERICRDTECKKHDAEKEFACFSVVSSEGIHLLGVCGPRIKRAGFNGKVSANSLSLKTPEGRNGRTNRRK